MTTTDGKSAMDQRKLNGVHSTINSLVGMYPADEWSLEESIAVRAALYEIARWRERGIHGDQLVKVAGEIEARQQTRALDLTKTEDLD